MKMTFYPIFPSFWFMYRQFLEKIHLDFGLSQNILFLKGHNTNKIDLGAFYESFHLEMMLIFAKNIR